MTSTTEAQNGRVLTHITALRAAGIALVLVYHLLPVAAPGGFIGVDVLFVVSGFLITGVLLRDDSATGAIQIGRFLARRAERLVPAALTVIAAVSVLVLLILPAIEWRETAYQAIASALYLQDLYLVQQAGDYLGADAGATVFQHFWSLSVEGQLYLLWAGVFGVAAIVCRAAPQRRRAAVLVTICVAVGVSLAYSALHSDAAGAYFTPSSRVWEFGIGALLAFVPRRLDGRARAAASIAGWTLLVASALVVTSSAAYPGLLALLPVCAVALVLSAGPFRVYGWRPVEQLGRLSYTLYLWHWPLLVLWPSLTGTAFDWSDSIAVLVVSVILAALTTRFVERRFWRPSVGPAPAPPRRTPRRALVFSATAIVVIGCLCSVQLVLVQRDRTEAERALAALSANADCFGSASLGDSACAPVALPNNAQLTLAGDDWGVMWGVGVPAGFDCVRTGDGFGQEELACDYGPERGARTLAVIGDSHGAQWVDAVLPIVDRLGWRLVVLDHSGCPAVDTTTLDPETSVLPAGCIGWAERAVAELEERADIDMIMVGSYWGAYAKHGDIGDDLGLTPQRIADMLDSAVTRWTASGKSVLVLGDTPQATFDPPECLASAADPVSDCAFRVSELAYPDTVLPLVARQLSGNERAAVLDPTGWFCVDDVCPPVIGGVVVLVDNNHMSRSYSLSLAPLLSAEFVRIGWLA